MFPHAEHDSSSSSEYDSDIVDLDFEEQEDPTVLEYARFHGLCTDYLLEQPHIKDVPIPSNDCFESDLRDHADSSLTNNAASELTKERLTVDKEVALLLRAIQQQQVPDEYTLLPSDDWRRAKKLKVEVPILKSDEELDLLSFGCTDTPSFSKLRIPYELIDVEKDEGFEWPKKYSDYPAQCNKQARAAKLSVSRDDLLFLGDMVKDHWTPEVSEQIKEESLKYMRVCVSMAQGEFTDHCRIRLFNRLHRRSFHCHHY
jgi:hypothetical protein